MPLKITSSLEEIKSWVDENEILDALLNVGLIDESMFLREALKKYQENTFVPTKFLTSYSEQAPNFKINRIKKEKTYSNIMNKEISVELSQYELVA